MSGCECASGFFSLRVCQNMVAGRCQTCRRAMCRQHADGEALTQCLDCAAKARRSAPGGRDRRRDTDEDDDWVFERRERLHGSRSTDSTHTAATAAAATTGVAQAQAFDAQDVAAFDDLGVERDDDEPAGSGFGDS